MRRIDAYVGRPDTQCYQCESCSCQWTLDNRPLKTGKLQTCRTAQKARAGIDLDAYSRWILVGILGLVLLFGLRFAGPFVVRFLLPAAVVAIVVYLVIRAVRQLKD